MAKSLRIVRASQHNLKAITCDIRRDALVVLTGPSGSGKSSLAFDTIFAEAQRRFIEAQSTSSQHFLQSLPKPDVESIEGLSPSIAIGQGRLSRSSRSTLGTATEIADYLRLLFARLAKAYCPVSGAELEAYSPQQMVDHVLSLPEGLKVILLAPIGVQSAEDAARRAAELSQQGFVRARLCGQEIELADAPAIAKGTTPSLELIIDRWVIKPNMEARVTDSIELALKLGNGTLFIEKLGSSERTILSEQLVSWPHQITLPPPTPSLFSFNSQHGACPNCAGLGSSLQASAERLIPNAELSIRGGALPALGALGSVAAAVQIRNLQKSVTLDLDVPWKELGPEVRHQILTGTSAKKTNKKGKWQGLIAYVESLLSDTPPAQSCDQDEGALSQTELLNFASQEPCSLCKGTRLRPEHTSFKLAGHTYSYFCELPLQELASTLMQLRRPLAPNARAVADPIVDAILQRLSFLTDLGLGYLTLARPTGTLSSGEGQRVRLAAQLGGSLTGMLYVLDEPAVGLHPKDISRLTASLQRLVQLGNSVLVVTHHRDIILAADEVLDLGPGAAAEGGHLVAQGSPEEIKSHPESPTGPYLAPKRGSQLPSRTLANTAPRLLIHKARANNLKQLDVQIPVGALTVVTGVSGSGKSSLVIDTLLASTKAKLRRPPGPAENCDAIDGLDRFDKVISIDATPIGRSPKSNPATYCGLFPELRTLFAGLPESRARGYKAGRFSFNVKGGRCEVCKGEGLRRIEMHFLQDVFVQCDSCSGARYNRETLRITFRGNSIAQILAMSVDDASHVLDNIPKIRSRLRALQQVGLGYLTLGQSATTLSGGEAQRLKLATELAKQATGNTLLILDEPTNGLHFRDTQQLLETLLALRDKGNTVVVIEHNLDVITQADWVIDLGPGAGAAGGQLVAAGSPAALSQHASSAMGRCIRKA